MWEQVTSCAESKSESVCEHFLSSSLLGGEDFGLTASISPPHPHPHRKTGLDKLQHSGAYVNANWEERVNVHGCLEPVATRCSRSRHRSVAEVS